MKTLMMIAFIFKTAMAVDVSDVVPLEKLGLKVGDKPLVLIESGTKCPIIRKYIPTVEALQKEFDSRAEIFFLNSAAHDDASSNAKEKSEYSITVRQWPDQEQKIARALGFKMTAQAVVLVKGKIVYRGAIDDSWTYEGSRPPTKHYLREAVTAALAGREPQERETRAYGCALTFRDQ